MNDDELPLLNSEITHSKNLVFIFQHLRNECNKELNFTRIYSAKINGDSSVTFHKHCDNKGPTLTIVQDSEGNVFGGFTNLSWKSANSAEWIGNDPSSFLFSVNKQKIILHDNDVREKTITVCRSNGPIFGDDDLVISDGCTRNYESWNFMKNSFGKKDNSISKSYLTSGKIEFLVSNYEVFSVE